MSPSNCRATPDAAPIGPVTEHAKPASRPQRVRFGEPAPRPPLALRFTPRAYLKLLYCCHAASTEVAGFGISAADDALLVVDDFALLRQAASIASVEFDDDAVADHADACADCGIPPSRSMRIWIHTHPGRSASPSSVDEETSARAFGACDWSVMAIVARGGERYARLQFSAGPGGAVQLPIEVDWSLLSKWLDEHQGHLDDVVMAWRHELAACVRAEPNPYAMPAFERAADGGPERASRSSAHRSRRRAEARDPDSIDHDMDELLEDFDPPVDDDAIDWLALMDEEVRLAY